MREAEVKDLLAHFLAGMRAHERQQHKGTGVGAGAGGRRFGKGWGRLQLLKTQVARRKAAQHDNGNKGIHMQRAWLQLTMLPLGARR